MYSSDDNKCDTTKWRTYFNNVKFENIYMYFILLNKMDIYSELWQKQNLGLAEE